MRPSIHYARGLFGSTPVMGVEVGVQYGDNAFVMLQDWYDGDFHLHLVEINASLESTIHQRLSRVVKTKPYYSRYTLHIGDTAEVAATFPDHSFEFAYIDDDHLYEGVLKSLAAWWPKVKIGGVFAGHDYMPGNPVADAVRNFLSEHVSHHLALQHLHLEDSDWWYVKQND